MHWKGRWRGVLAVGRDLLAQQRTHAVDQCLALVPEPLRLGLVAVQHRLPHAVLRLLRLIHQVRRLRLIRGKCPLAPLPLLLHSARTISMRARPMAAFGRSRQSVPCRATISASKPASVM